MSVVDIVVLFITYVAVALFWFVIGLHEGSKMCEHCEFHLKLPPKGKD
jgi:hypothetical protein